MSDKSPTGGESTEPKAKPAPPRRLRTATKDSVRSSASIPSNASNGSSSPGSYSILVESPLSETGNSGLTRGESPGSPSHPDSRYPKRDSLTVPSETPKAPLADINRSQDSLYVLPPKSPLGTSDLTPPQAPNTMPSSGVTDTSDASGTAVIDPAVRR